MKKLLLSGITAVALMAAGTAQAGVGLDLYGGTGVARTPLAIALAPMEFQIAADWVFSDDTFVPLRAAVGLPYGIEIGGAYWYTDPDMDTADVEIDIYDLTAKWVLPSFYQNLSLAIGGHYSAQQFDINAINFDYDNDGYDLYAVATYVAPVGEGLSLIPSVGVLWETKSGDPDDDAFKFFASLLFKGSNWAVGGEYLMADENVDAIYDPNGLLVGDADPDDFWWIGGRYYLNPMVTFQGGYINNANLFDDDGEIKDGIFHLGVQFAFQTGK